MTIDEVLKRVKDKMACGYHISGCDTCNISSCEDRDTVIHLVEWLEKLKIIKEMDLSIPQHFTKEQSEWVKAYCIKRNKEFYNKAIDDLLKDANEMAIEVDAGTYTMKAVGIGLLEQIAEQLKEKK